MAKPLGKCSQWIEDRIVPSEEPTDLYSLQSGDEGKGSSRKDVADELGANGPAWSWLTLTKKSGLCPASTGERWEGV